MTKRSTKTNTDGNGHTFSPNGTQSGPSGKLQEQDDPKVGLGKKVTLLRGIAIIIGTIIGAGIFISPKGILKHSGSVGMSLIVWISCGVLSLFGELVHECWWDGDVVPPGSRRNMLEGRMTECILCLFTSSTALGRQQGMKRKDTHTGISWSRPAFQKPWHSENS